ARVLVAGRAAREARARRADRAVGPNQRDFDPRRAENAAEGPGDPLADRRQRLAALDRGEAPDQVVVAAPCALRRGGPRLLIPYDRHLLAFALAPRGPRGAGELLARGAVD